MLKSATSTLSRQTSGRPNPHHEISCTTRTCVPQHRKISIATEDNLSLCGGEILHANEDHKRPADQKWIIWMNTNGVRILLSLSKRPLSDPFPITLNGLLRWKNGDIMLRRMGNGPKWMQNRLRRMGNGPKWIQSGLGQMSNGPKWRINGLTRWEMDQNGYKMD
jgi:hypothetical protein